jgi:hypothetical protein
VGLRGAARRPDVQRILSRRGAPGALPGGLAARRRPGLPPHRHRPQRDDYRHRRVGPVHVHGDDHGDDEPRRTGARAVLQTARAAASAAAPDRPLRHDPGEGQAASPGGERSAPHDAGRFPRPSPRPEGRCR